MKLGCWGWWAVFWFTVSFTKGYSDSGTFAQASIEGVFAAVFWAGIPWLVYRGLMGIAGLFKRGKRSVQDEQSNEGGH